MKLSEIFEDSETIRDELRKNRGKKLVNLVRAKAARRNPRPDEEIGPEGGDDPNQYDNTPTADEIELDWT